MIRWKIDNKVISELYYKGVNVIYPWGLETADSSAFFSMENGYGYRYNVISEKYTVGNGEYNGSVKVKMMEGSWSLNFKDTIVNDRVINRFASLICIEDSYFMDFVVRFRVKKEFIKVAIINGQEIYHRNTNIYYQFAVDNVLLVGQDEFNIKVSIVDVNIPDRMRPLMYVRDLNDEWIIHVRMLPEEYNKVVIKLCNKWYKTKPIPQFLSNLILYKFKFLNELWYRGEFRPFKSRILRLINPAAIPLIKLKRGTELMWNVNFEFQDVK